MIKFILGFLLGNLTGIFIMCLFQLNKEEIKYDERKFN